ASEFVQWWMTNSMNYQQQNAAQSHSTAFQWMTPEAKAIFQSQFWTPEMAEGVATGRMCGAYQPASCQAVALNPDGTVVISTTGTLAVQQSNGIPNTRQIAVDYLVRKEPGGLRIAGLYNRDVSAQPVAAAQ